MTRVDGTGLTKPKRAEVSPINCRPVCLSLGVHRSLSPYYIPRSLILSYLTERRVLALAFILVPSIDTLPNFTKPAF
jgi:hypothetical protein